MKQILTSGLIIAFTVITINACSSNAKPQGAKTNSPQSQKDNAKEAQRELSRETSK